MLESDKRCKQKMGKHTIFCGGGEGIDPYTSKYIYKDINRVKEVEKRRIEGEELVRIKLGRVIIYL